MSVTRNGVRDSSHSDSRRRGERRTRSVSNRSRKVRFTPRSDHAENGHQLFRRLRSASTGSPSHEGILSMSTTSATGRPTTVTVSFILWLIVVVVGIIGGIINVIGVGSQTDDTTMRAGLTVGAVIAIVIALVELFIVFKMRDGRNWARIVLLVLAILQLLGIFAAFSVFGTITLILVIVATVLMFLPASNAYFRKH
ncbi:hypothetical protein DEJ31_08775 [Curtobacterium sp. MCPF17_031]|nr:hypothetical protein DEI89_04155 [Curtobacterium sp. MCBD17_030]PZE37236.1 hypothetical protein DEJ31_08775 [Curtobacterium sp. MCPF17_031]